MLDPCYVERQFPSLGVLLGMCSSRLFEGSILLCELMPPPTPCGLVDTGEAGVCCRGLVPVAGKVLESMPYADAVIKEALRVHPIVSSLFRRTLQVRIVFCGVCAGWHCRAVPCFPSSLYHARRRQCLVACKKTQCFLP